MECSLRNSTWRREEEAIDEAFNATRVNNAASTTGSGITREAFGLAAVSDMADFRRSMAAEDGEAYTPQKTHKDSSMGSPGIPKHHPKKGC